jgi:hypothetical protein
MSRATRVVDLGRIESLKGLAEFEQYFKIKRYSGTTGRFLFHFVNHTDPASVELTATELGEKLLDGVTAPAKLTFTFVYTNQLIRGRMRRTHLLDTKSVLKPLCAAIENDFQRQANERLRQVPAVPPPRAIQAVVTDANSLLTAEQTTQDVDQAAAAASAHEKPSVEANVPDPTDVNESAFHLNMKKQLGAEETSRPTLFNASEFIWFFDIEVHNGWPARNICQLTAVRADGRRYIDEYIHHRELHRSYYETMLLHRVLVSLTPHARPSKLLQLSPWDDPNASIDFALALIRWFSLLHENSLLVYMGSTDPSVLLQNVYDRLGDNDVVGVLRHLMQGQYWTVKYLDVRKMVRQMWALQGVSPVDNRVAPGGSLSKVHKTLFIDPMLQPNSTIVTTEQQKRFAAHFMGNGWHAPAQLGSGKAAIRIEMTERRVPIWHTSHTDALVLKNIVSAILFSVCTFKREYGDVMEHHQLAMQYLVMVTRAFTTHTLILPHSVAASFYQAVVTERHAVVLPTHIADSPTLLTSGRQTFCDKTPNRLTAKLFLHEKRAQKTAAWKDEHIDELQSDTDEARASMTFTASEVQRKMITRSDTSSTAMPLSNRRHDASRQLEMSGNQVIYKGRTMSQAAFYRLRTIELHRMLDEQLPGKKELNGLPVTVQDAQGLEFVKKAVELTAKIMRAWTGSELTPMRFWPILYLPSAAGHGRQCVVLHNIHCHLLYTVDTSQPKINGLFYPRVLKREAHLVAALPMDMLFFEFKPVFCKQCKAYVDDLDQEVPLLTLLRKQADPLSYDTRSHRYWNPNEFDIDGHRIVAWPLSYQEKNVGVEDEMVAKDIFHTKPTTKEPEDAEFEQSPLEDATGFPAEVTLATTTTTTTSEGAPAGSSGVSQRAHQTAADLIQSIASMSVRDLFQTPKS